MQEIYQKVAMQPKAITFVKFVRSLEGWECLRTLDLGRRQNHEEVFTFRPR